MTGKVHPKIYHQLINGVPIALAITDSKDEIVELNDAFCKLLECVRPELLGQNILEIGIKDDGLKSRISNGLNQAGKLEEYEISFIPKKKEPRRALFSVSPLDQLGDGFNIITLSNITTGKIFEKESADTAIIPVKPKDYKIEQENANNLLHTLLHSIPIMVCWKDRNSKYLGANHLFLRIVHLSSQEELIGKTDEELFGKEMAARFNEFDHEVIQSGKAKVFYEEPFIDGFGREGWLMKSKTPIKNNDGEVIGILVTGQDITEKKRIEIELKQSESKYRSLFENMTSGFVLSEMIYDADGNPYDYCFVEINPAFERITGMPVSKFIGKTARESLSPERQYLIELYGKVAKTGIPVQYETFAYNNWFEVYSFRPKDNFFAIVFNDIGERKKAEDEIKRKNEELTKINKELDKFVYSASHDLRAPIATLLGLIEIAKITQERGEIDLYLEKQKVTLKKMDDFIHEIVNYSRNDRLEVSSEPIDLERLVDDLFEQYNYINNASFVKKELRIDGDIPFYSDKQRISVILSNLISNGLKYADLRKAEPFLLVDINIEKNQVLISVEDNGEGIPRDYLDKIFEMFVRASNNSTGSGLGLYIVKEVLEKLNGSIQVHSEYGKKTVFIASIPNLG